MRGAAGRRLGKRSSKPVQENVIPLINVVFLLLVFFMVAGRITPSEPMPLAPPASHSEANTQTAGTTVFVGPGGEIFVGMQAVALEDLARVLQHTATITEAAPAQATDEPLLQVKADASADAAYVVTVLDAIRGSGIERVRLLTQAGP